jgi:hypothetical protein
MRQAALAGSARKANLDGLDDARRPRAKARGVKFGRPTALTPHQRQEALRRLANGEAQADVARSFKRQSGDDQQVGSTAGASSHHPRSSAHLVHSESVTAAV